VEPNNVILVSWTALFCGIFTLGLIIAIVIAVGLLLVLHVNLID